MRSSYKHSLLETLPYTHMPKNRLEDSITRTQSAWNTLLFFFATLINNVYEEFKMPFS